MGLKRDALRYGCQQAMALKSDQCGIETVASGRVRGAHAGSNRTNVGLKPRPAPTLASELAVLKSDQCGIET